MSFEEQRKIHLCIVAVLLCVATLSAVACALIFGKFYNLNRTLGYPDITDALGDALDNNSTDTGGTVKLSAGSTAEPAYYVIPVGQIRLVLDGATPGVVVYGRGSWPPTADNFDAISNGTIKSRTLQSCYGDFLFLGVVALNESLIGQTVNVTITPDRLDEDECARFGIGGVTIGILVGSFGAACFLVGLVILAVVLIGKMRTRSARFTAGQHRPLLRSG